MKLKWNCIWTIGSDYLLLTRRKRYLLSEMGRSWYVFLTSWSWYYLLTSGSWYYLLTSGLMILFVKKWKLILYVNKWKLIFWCKAFKAEYEITLFSDDFMQNKFQQRQDLLYLVFCPILFVIQHRVIIIDDYSLYYLVVYTKYFNWFYVSCSE